MMESTGMSGRLPVLSVQVNPSHGVVVMVQTKRNTWPGGTGGVLLKPAARSVSDWGTYCRRAGIQGDAHDRTVGQNGVAAGHVHPSGLSLRARTRVQGRVA